MGGNIAGVGGRRSIPSIPSAVLFLVFDLAIPITGRSLVVDGYDLEPTLFISPDDLAYWRMSICNSASQVCGQEG